MGLFRAVGRCLYDRLQLSAIVDLLTKHKAPPGAERGKSGWMYVFGFSVLVSFLVQIATGAALLGTYIPSPESAHASLDYLTHGSSLGAFARAAAPAHGPPVRRQLLRHPAAHQVLQLDPVLVLDLAGLADGVEQLQHPLQLGQRFRHLGRQIGQRFHVDTLPRSADRARRDRGHNSRLQRQQAGLLSAGAELGLLRTSLHV